MPRKPYMQQLAETIDPNAHTYNLCTICGEKSNFSLGNAIRWETRNGGVCNGCVTTHRGRWKKENYTSAYLKKKAKQILEKQPEEQITMEDIFKVRAMLKGESKF